MYSLQFCSCIINSEPTFAINATFVGTCKEFVDSWHRLLFQWVIFSNSTCHNLWSSFGFIDSNTDGYSLL